MPLVIGHRGAPGYLPEHSRSSYLRAIAEGVDAVEPDVVPSKDGVLVVRHENEISGTTDVSTRPAFAGRRTSKVVDGEHLTGWFVEDFTWEELRTLQCRERIPALRPDSAAHDDTEPVLRLRDVLDLARQGGVAVVLEIKHAASFARLGFDLAELVDAELRAAGWWDAEDALVIESFEPLVLARLRERGIRVPLVQLIEARGRRGICGSGTGRTPPRTPRCGPRQVSMPSPARCRASVRTSARCSRPTSAASRGGRRGSCARRRIGACGCSPGRVGPRTPSCCPPSAAGR